MASVSGTLLEAAQQLDEVRDVLLAAISAPQSMDMEAALQQRLVFIQCVATLAHVSGVLTGVAPGIDEEMA